MSVEFLNKLNIHTVFCRMVGWAVSEPTVRPAVRAARPVQERDLPLCARLEWAPLHARGLPRPVLSTWGVQVGKSHLTGSRLILFKAKKKLPIRLPCWQYNLILVPCWLLWHVKKKHGNRKWNYAWPEMEILQQQPNSRPDVTHGGKGTWKY